MHLNFLPDNIMFLILFALSNFPQLGFFLWVRAHDGPIPSGMILNDPTRDPVITDSAEVRSHTFTGIEDHPCLPVALSSM